MGCGLVAALPALGIMTRLWQLGWTPQSDDAALSWRAWMVTAGRPTFTGPFTLATNDGVWTYNPGPLYFWVLALPTRIAPGIGPLLAVTALGVAALVAGIVAAGQMGGRWLPVMFAAAGLIGARGAAGAFIDPVWNIYSVLLPFTGLVLMTWAITFGRLAWWPVAVFLGSYAAQTHLTFTLPATMLVLIGPPLGIWALKQRDEVVRWRWLALGGVIGVLAWAAPLWEEATGKPGNLTTLWRTSLHGQGTTVGMRASLRLYGWSVAGKPPPWLHHPRIDPMLITAFKDTTAPVMAPLVLLALLVALVVGVRRRQHDVIGIVAIALAVSASVILQMRGVSGSTWFFGSWYLITVLYPVGMVVTFALAWTLWRFVVEPAYARWGNVPIETWRTTFATLALAGVLTTWWMAHWALPIWEEPKTGWRSLSEITDQTIALVEQGGEPPGRLALDATGLPLDLRFRLPRSLGYELLQRGWTPTVGNFDLKMIAVRKFYTEPTDRTLVYSLVGTPPPQPESSVHLGTIHEPITDDDYDVYIVDPPPP
jgi:hypothetical protein